MKESPLNYYFNTLKKDQKNEEYINDSEAKKYHYPKENKDINIPKFPDLSITKEDDNFEMNSKDFLENNRIIRNDLIRNNFFQKKLNNDFIKEIYDSINNEEKIEYQLNPFPSNNQRNCDKKSAIEDNNFLFFESFNEQIPKIINAGFPQKTYNDNITKTVDYFSNETNNNNSDQNANLHRKDFYMPLEYPKNTPEFQKFQTRISNMDDPLKILQKKNSIPSFGNNSGETYTNNNSSKCSKSPKNNYDMPLKCDDRFSESLLKDFNSFNSKSNKSLQFSKIERKSFELFDENTDENISRDLRTKLNDHLLNNKENTTKFARVKKIDNLYDQTFVIDDITSFKNTNSSVMNQNSDRMKSSPIISIHIHESIKKDMKTNEKKNVSNEFKFLEDYKLESAKAKQIKLQNEIANKNSTTVGLSSINTDNNSEKPLYVLNMEIISSNCLSPIVKENIINMLKSNSNYVSFINIMIFLLIFH